MSRSGQGGRDAEEVTLREMYAAEASKAARACKDCGGTNGGHFNYQVGGSHYANKVVQPWDAMEAWMSPEQFAGFLRGNAIKYVARYQDKGGKEDIRKAIHYLEKLLEVMQ